MDRTDALGRRRRPSQIRGLRSLYPKLPGAYQSRAIRVAMALESWQRIERLASRSSAPTLPRAYGEVMEQLLENFDSFSRDVVRPTFQALHRSVEKPIYGTLDDWQAWQMQKDLALLAASAPDRWERDVSHAPQ
jgi:hypothetical protein